MASESAAAGNSRKRKIQDEQDEMQICPFLDTIQRSVLDFDLEPACSVSLVKGPHIYACLVCGKYFRGRGSSTPAYTHAVEESHFVFCHLSKGTFHCLPDDYEIQDPSLQDIRDALHPTFTKAEIAKLDSNTELARDLFGRMYLPGFVGLNNHHKTDGINAVVQALAHVRPLRDFFLGKHHDDHLSDASQQQKHRSSYDVTRCFGELVRKLWSDRRFKSHVDPHMLVNAIAAASNKKYGAAGRQVEAGEFMAWFLHQLHLGTGGSLKKKKKKSTSIIEQTFQGQVRVTTRQAKRQTFKRTNSDEQDDRAGSDAEDDNEDAEMKEASQKEEQEDEIRIEETTVDSHFLQLTLDISEKPLFRDEDGGLVIPQEPLVTVLKKFDGVTFTDALSRSGVAQKRKYALQKLPDYLILHLNRFKTNEYSREKNPTIVAFPVKNLDLSDYVQPEGGHRPIPPTEDQVRQMSVSQVIYIQCWNLTSDSLVHHRFTHTRLFAHLSLALHACVHTRAHRSSS